MGLAAGSVCWYRERATAADLQNRWAALQQYEAQLAALRTEHESLREQLATLAPAPSDAAGASPRPTTLGAQSKSLTPLTLGEWSAANTWANAGRSTPLTTVTTLLWAAAGGDQTTMQSALMFDDATRAQALALYDSLPPATRSLYATPEELIADVTMKNIPLTAAQVCWFNQADADHATVGVMLAHPREAVSGSSEIMEAPEAGAPPRLANSAPNPLAVLSLRRVADGWRVVVPAAAIARIAAELRPPAAD